MSQSPLAIAIESHKCPLCWRTFPRLLKSPRTIYGIRTCTKCRKQFASRRQLAFFIDFFLFYVMFFMPVVGLEAFLGISAGPTGLAPGVKTLLFVIGRVGWILFLAKDGFSGRSIGKRITGVQVVDRVTLRPIGFGRSFKRNLPLLPFLAIFPILLLIPGLLLAKGHRWGDKWANTTVIWRRYRFRLPFDQRGLLCMNCGYNLTGNTSGRCPECGTPIPEIPTAVACERRTSGEANAGLPQT